MHELSKSFIPPGATIGDAIRAIDSGPAQIALVVDGDGQLVGTITDGDVRRALIRGLGLDTAAGSIMNTRPTVAASDVADPELLATMRATMHRAIPVLDANRRVVRVAQLGDLIHVRNKPNRVVVMAGGLGTRLSPLTADRPKPLIDVGSRPVLETMIESLRDFGFRHIYLAVNYKAEMVKKHFGSGGSFGLTIRYLEESERLGTAGALGLLPEKLEQPLLVVNGDVLTKINFDQLLDFHTAQRAAATMCVREYDIQIPYGVVKIEDHRIRAIDEKPVQRFFVNGGIYVLEPDVVEHVSGALDMPALFEGLIAAGRETVAFPIREYWVDIGQIEDLERARSEYPSIYKEQQP